jgi:uncharacterized protein YlxW (UPF0749 family)
MNDKSWRAIFMLGTGLLMGGLFAFQAKSVGQASLSYSRDSRVSIFKEMQIVKKSNENLAEQQLELERELAAGDNKEKALENLKNEIEKYQLISGEKAAVGEGVEVTINGELEALWFTDMVNELFAAGAEAISINGMRLAPSNLGFDTMPNGQILFGGEILSPPFKFSAIGDSKNLAGSLNQQGGIVSRIQSYKPDYQITVTEQNKLELPAIAQGK